MKILYPCISILVLGCILFLFSMQYFTYGFNPNATKYGLVKTWGSKGTGNGQFERPHDLDFSNDGKYLYSVDRDGNRIQVFDKNGTFLFKWGKLGTGDGDMHVPYGIDVDAAGNIWLSDRAN